MGTKADCVNLVVKPTASAKVIKLTSAPKAELMLAA